MENMADEFFKLLVDAVIEGLKELKIVIEQNNYIPSHYEWYTIDTRKNGFPSFNKNPFNSRPDYSDAFSYHSRNKFGPIDIEQLKSFTNFKDYCKSHSDSLGHYIPKNLYQKESNTDKQFDITEFYSIYIIRSLIERYYEINKTCDFDALKFNSIIEPVLNRLFSDRLSFDIYIPILFVKFSFGTYNITDDTSIVEMDELFHRSRATIKMYSPSINESVLSSSTHALVLKNWSIENVNHFQLSESFRTTSFYPLGLIDKFFGAMRLVKNIAVGYCQLIISPIDWVDMYKADLLPLEGTSYRNYPSIFDDYYWNNENLPIVSKEDMAEISHCYIQLKEIEENKIALAINRLNRCFLRDDYEDSILDATIGLEALLIDNNNQEMTYKLALRTAYLSKYFVNSSKKPQEVFDDIKKIYKMRSTIVHGKHKKNFENIFGENKELSSPETKEAIDYLRKVLLTLINNQEYIQEKNIDLNMLSNKQ